MRASDDEQGTNKLRPAEVRRKFFTLAYRDISDPPYDH